MHSKPKSFKSPFLYLCTLQTLLFIFFFYLGKLLMDNKDFLKSKGKSIETIDHYRLTKRQSHGWCKYKKVQYRCTASKNLYDLTIRTAATSCGVRGESNKENLFFISSNRSSLSFSSQFNSWLHATLCCGGMQRSLLKSCYLSICHIYSPDNHQTDITTYLEGF